jgi:hypothetical protein
MMADSSRSVCDKDFCNWMHAAATLLLLALAVYISYKAWQAMTVSLGGSA